MNDGFSDAWDALCAEQEIPDGRLLIWEQALTALEEQIEYLIDRAKYHDEVPGPDEFIAQMQDLTSRIKQIRKTAGESLD